jgi:hypothetical protein
MNGLPFQGTLCVVSMIPKEEVLEGGGGDTRQSSSSEELFGKEHGLFH